MSDENLSEELANGDEGQDNANGQEHNPADVNQDGVVDSQDAAAVADAIAEENSQPEEGTPGSLGTEDGPVDAIQNPDGSVETGAEEEAPQGDPGDEDTPRAEGPKPGETSFHGKN